jgi:hypothetical protein
MNDQSDSGPVSRYQPPHEFLSREEFFGVALPMAYQEEGSFSLVILRQNDWRGVPLDVMAAVRRRMDHHVLRAVREVPGASYVCRPLLMNAVAAIVRLTRGEALLTARSIVERVASEPVPYPGRPDGYVVRLSGAVYDSGSWRSPALLAFMTVDMSRDAEPGMVLPLL